LCSPDEPLSSQLGATLETIQSLLLKLIQQGETLIQQGEKARCVRGINLEVLQEVLAACCAGRFGLWDSLAVPALIEDGRTSHEIASLFESQTTKGKAVAYGLAKEIKDQLCARQADSLDATNKDEDESSSNQ